MKIYCDSDDCQYNDEGECKVDVLYVETVADTPTCMSESIYEEE